MRRPGSITRFFAMKFVRCLTLALGALSLSACYIVKPRTVVAYDDECELGYRKMVLTVEHESLLTGGGCYDGSSCGELLLAGLIVTPASAIVSGSIMLVGNTIYWIEKQGRCDVEEAGSSVVPAGAT